MLYLATESILRNKKLTASRFGLNQNQYQTLKYLLGLLISISILSKASAKLLPYLSQY